MGASRSTRKGVARKRGVKKTGIQSRNVMRGVFVRWSQDTGSTGLCDTTAELGTVTICLVSRVSYGRVATLRHL